MAIFAPVGPSNAPMATPIQSLSSGSQKREDPHTEQKPRRTFADERYQERCSPPSIVILARGTSVETKTCPECLRHAVQWQASGGGSAPCTSKRTALQRQDPRCTSPSVRCGSGMPLGRTLRPARGTPQGDARRRRLALG